MAKGEATLWLRIKTAGEEALSKMGGLLKGIGEIGTVAFGALSLIATKAIHDFREQEEATNSLTRAMINNGTYTKELKDEYLAQASALQKLTTFGDEQIIAAQASLAQQAGGIKITQELTMAILDFAEAQKMDAASAANLVGKSIGTATNALGRYGIEINTSATESEKMSQALEGLNRKFGGQAAAATDGLGALKQLNNVVSDLFEVLGERLAPVINLASRYFTTLASDTSQTAGSMDALVTVFQFVSKVGTTLTNMLLLLGDTIGIGLAASVEGVSALMSGEFSKAKDIVAMGYDSMKEAALTRTEDTNNALLAIDAAFSQKKEENNQAELAKLKDALQKKAEVKLLHDQETRTKELEKLIADQEIEMGILAANEEQKSKAILDAQIKREQLKLQNATTANAKLAATEEIHRLNELKKQQVADEAMKAARAQTLSTIATLQNEGNATLAAAGKAAALMQIAIATPPAVAEAIKWGTAVGGPPGGIIAGGLIYTAMGAQAAKVAGIPLAEGGIVKARPGGIQATIGEGGQDEAVIPLDKAGQFGGGGNTIIINSYGGMLGSPSEAYEFAKAVDRNLLELRRNNESVAFDSGVT